MGLTQRLGTIPLAIQTDSSNNVGIGGAANASYKLAVTGNTLGTGTAFDFFTSSGIGSSGVTGLLRVVTAGTSSAIAIGQANSSRYTSIQANEYITYNDDMSFRTFGSFPLTLGTNNTTRLTISATGNVGIGTSSPTVISGFTSVCVNNATTGGFFEAQQGGTVLTRFGGQSDIAFIDTVANIPFIIKTNSTERMRISSGGDVLVGTTDNAARLVVRGISDSGSNFALWVTNSLGSLGLGVRNDTLIQAPGIHSYSYASTANVFVQSDGFLGRNTSSLKYKKNVEDYTRGLADVLKLRPVLYESKNPSEANKKFTGFIAEEIDALGLTEFVQYAEDGSPDALQYPHFVALLAAAIQELNAKVTALENK